MAPTMDVRGGLANELKRLVRDASEWPPRDRRRFRNMLLDAVSSDAMPMAELLLRAHDDGMLANFPLRTAPRGAWDSATARLASDLQTQRFVDPGIARFVAESWAAALGPDVILVSRAASPRPAFVPRVPARSSATMSPRPAPTSATSAASSAASMKAYRQTNALFVIMVVTVAVLTILAFRSTSGRANQPATAQSSAGGVTQSPTAMTAPVSDARAATATPQSALPHAVVRGTASESAPAHADSTRASRDFVAPPPRVGRQPVAVASAPARTTDDIVLNAGRVFEGRVLSVRQQSITVKDEETGLDFEIAKADIDRIVTRDGRIMRFGDDNVPLLGDDDELTPVSHSGRYKVRYSERWGAERSECSGMARNFAPGSLMVVQHLRGAPMLQLAFVFGQAFNAAVRSDGLFESGADVASVRGPRNAFVSTRISGRFSHGGVLQGVARLSAVQSDGTVVCDVALTMHGERQP